MPRDPLAKDYPLAKNWPQLDQEALDLAQAWLAAHGDSRAALARHLGVSRSAISQALDGRYPGDTRKLRAKLVERLAELVRCPHLAADLTPAECRAYRERPLSSASASRSDVKHWQACQGCPLNPDRIQDAAA